MSRPQFLLLTALIGLLALLLREYFLLVSTTDALVRGDSVQYVRYAWNLLHHHIFSLAAPSAEAPLPDAYRSPGYPLLIALAMAISDSESGWIAPMLHGQALLGAVTAVLIVTLTRHALGRGWSLLAGGLVAVQPHSIVASGALLVEVALAFFLVLAALASVRAYKTKQAIWAALAGLTFGFAYLINPVVLFLPLLAALVCAKAGAARPGLLMLALMGVVAAGWAIRTQALPEQPERVGRAATNLVQGSWPIYHRAWQSRLSHPQPRAILAAMDEEAALLQRDRAAGARAILERIAQDPGYYLRWYALEKPWLLWDWSIRIGWGGIYFLKIEHSPLDTQPLLRALVAVQRALNPLVFALALAMAVGALVRWRRAANPAEAVVLTLALAFFYLTAVHVVFQAEPRYAIAYRPLQLALAVSGLAALAAAASAAVHQALSSRTQ